MGIIPHFLLQCAFQRAFQNVFQPQPYCRLGFKKSVTPFPKSPRTHSAREPEPQAAKSIVYRVPSPAPVGRLIFRLSACRSAVCGITQRAYYVMACNAYTAAHRVRAYVRGHTSAHHAHTSLTSRLARPPDLPHASAASRLARPRHTRHVPPIGPACAQYALRDTPTNTSISNGSSRSRYPRFACSTASVYSEGYQPNNPPKEVRQMNQTRPPPDHRTSR